MPKLTHQIFKKSSWSQLKIKISGFRALWCKLNFHVFWFLICILKNWKWTKKNVQNRFQKLQIQKHVFIACLPTQPYIEEIFTNSCYLERSKQNPRYYYTLYSIKYKI